MHPSDGKSDAWRRKLSWFLVLFGLLMLLGCTGITGLAYLWYQKGSPGNGDTIRAAFGPVQIWAIVGCEMCALIVDGFSSSRKVLLAAGVLLALFIAVTIVNREACLMDGAYRLSTQTTR